MESGEVKPADSEPDRSAATPLDDQKGVTEPVHRISSMSGHHGEVPVQGFDSQVNITDDIGIIRLEEYGIEVHVPSGEAYSAKDITVDVIDEVPPELLTVLKETEAIITVGVKMSPSDASFERPVKVTMPHCGVFQKPESAQIVTYYRKNASDSFTAIPSSKKGLQCIVRQRDLDIYLNHFSESWIVALFTWAFIGKRVICTPYIPVSTPKNAKHVLRLHVRDENFRERKIEEGYKAGTTGKYFLVRWRSGGLHITCTCPESSLNDKVKTIDGSKITHLPENEVSFIVDTRNSEDDYMILEFIIKQSTIENILVKICLQDPVVGETTQEQAISTSQRPVTATSPGIQPTPRGATSDVPTLHHRFFQEGLAGHVLSDAILLDLSRRIDCTVYPVSDFAVDLGFDGATATSAEQMSIQTMDSQRRYKIILDKFVLNNGRGAQKIIDVFKDKKKQLLVDLIKEAIAKQDVHKESGTI
ncbi:uncharacterized protein LOC129279520 [Lytechinus pictus]|uniref:uncharacterized protein LOC129279520 n=1 Tax=Lytechinus pictus TaxID=7653 RepID=UPI0030B9B4E2